MTLSELRRFALGDCPVVLLEGRQAIAPLEASAARAFAARLVRACVRLRLRSGNAEGSDEAFSARVAEVEALRLQVIAPSATHRRKVCYADPVYSLPESLSTVEEAALNEATVAATPRNAHAVDKCTGSPRLAAKAAYLHRDTIKVLGHSGEFGPPFYGLFYVDLTDPEAGGTGYTLRVCPQHWREAGWKQKPHGETGSSALEQCLEKAWRDWKPTTCRFGRVRPKNEANR